MKKWDVWSEGYKLNGNESDAEYHGEWAGETFEDACRAWAASTQDPSFYNAERNTYYGCRLFDNETAARESFG